MHTPDLRNSRSPDILRELRAFGIAPLVHDAEADAAAVAQEFGLAMDGLDRFVGLDALILAVTHRSYVDDLGRLQAMVRPGGVFLDLKSTFSPADLRPDLVYWSL